MPVAPRPGSSAWRRYPTYLAGLTMVGTGVAITIRAELGVAPFDVLTTGLASATGMAIAVAAVLVPIAFVTVGLLLRGPFGPGTPLAVAVVGPVIGLGLEVLPTVEAMAPRLGMFVAGTAITALGVTGVVIGRVGPGPSEMVMLAIHERGHGLAPARTAIEVSCVLGGWALGGQVGIGTVVFALAIGPVLARLLGLAGYDHHATLEAQVHATRA